jgi:hypothetical protein
VPKFLDGIVERVDRGTGAHDRQHRSHCRRFSEVGIRANGGAPVYCVIHDVKQRDKAFPATLADLAFPIRTTGRRCADRARPNLSNAVKSEKHGEVAPEDLSGNLIVQLGLATEKLNGAVVSKAPPKGGISCGVVQPPLDPFFCCRPMR